MARQICGSKDLADDLVQDMYLKFHNYNKELNDFYIYFAIKSIYLDILKKAKIDIKDTEIDNLNIEDDQYCLNKDFYETEIINQVAALPYFERETLKVTQIISQRELARNTDIPFITINQTVKKTKEELRIWAEKIK